MNPGRLTAAQRAAFERDGFLVLPSVFSSTEVTRLRAAFDRLQAAAATLPGTGLHRGSLFVIDPAPALRIHRVVWCGAAEAELSRFGADPRLVGLAADLLGSDHLDQLINQAHFKLPGDEVEFPWHQDSRHRRYGTPEWTDVDGRGSFVELACALDPVGPDNGPLALIPGSHRLGHLSTDPVTRALPADAFDASRAVTPALSPGDVLAFGPFVIHGSAPNRGSRPRRLFLNGFALPGANHRVYPGEGAGRSVEAPKDDLRSPTPPVTRGRQAAARKR